MPPIGTPSPFRFPPRPNPSRANRSPQFASTPRFLLSQDTPRPQDDIDADESPFSTPVASARSTGGNAAGSASRRDREVIEDPDGGLSQETETGRRMPDADIDSSPAGCTGAIDAEFDLLFGSAPDRSKRRRISAERDANADADTPLAQRGRARFEPILSSPELSPPQGPSSPGLHSTAQGPGTSDRMPANTTTSTIPASIGTPRQPSSTPGTTKPPPGGTTTTTTTPFRTQHPRFMLSASQQHLPSGTQTQLNPTPRRDKSPPTRRKPAFIIPRSPSPSDPRDENPSAIPTPFSPTSHALRRRGRRSRAGAAHTHGYVPGGMAAEVRSWVLEMGAKREQQQQQQQRRVPDSSVSGADARGYFLLGRIRKVRQDVLGSSGPVAFVEVLCDGDASTAGPETESDSRARLINILLFGMPRPQSGQVAGNNGIPGLRPDGLVGVHKGLIWEIELDDARPGSSGSDKEKWLVCMEWDLIQ